MKKTMKEQLVVIGYNISKSNQQSRALVSGEIKNANYLISALAENNINIITISINLFDEAIDSDYEIKKSNAKGFLRWIVEARNLNKILNKIECDNIYLSIPSYLPFIRKRFKKRIITAHGTYWPELKADLHYEKNKFKILLHLLNGKIQLLIDKLAVKQSTHIHSVSEYQLNEMTQTYRADSKKLFALRNGTNFHNSTIEHELKQYNIAWIGRLAKKKNLGLMKRFMELNPALNGWICVGNKYFSIDKLSGKIAHEISEDMNIEIYKDISDQKLNSLLNDTRVLIITSTGYESIPTVILEGLNSGCKVLAPNSWGISEIKHHNLIMYNEGSLESLIEKFNRIDDFYFSNQISNIQPWKFVATKFIELTSLEK